MNNNVKFAIGELKEVVMDLHRSAGRLDDIIQGIEREEAENEPFFEMYIKAQAQYRGNIKTVFGDLDAKETLIWEKLINLAKKES
jgi:Mg2+ and Co2+ transporter CorA